MPLIPFNSSSQTDSSFRSYSTAPADIHFIDEYTVTIRAPPETDWWRVPKEEPPIDRRTGPLFATKIDPERPFRCGVWIKGGKWEKQFDQAALMFVQGNWENDKVSWIKSGIEMENGLEFIKYDIILPVLRYQ